MDEVINYVMETPGNTNPNVLKGMLNELAPEPSGTIEITQNGIVDVSEYAEANVNIPPTEYELIPLNITNQSGKPLIFNNSYFFENGKLMTRHYGTNGGTEDCYLPYFKNSNSAVPAPFLSYIARIIVQYTNKTIVVTGGENTQVTILTQYYNAPNQEAIVQIYQTDFSVDPSITISLTD